MTSRPSLLSADAEPGLQLPDITWPALALGVAIVVVGWLVGRALRLGVRRLLMWRGRSPSASALFARLTGWGVGVVAIAAAITVVFPSVEPVNALGGIGILSIAAGIAFQTVLGNMFAGIVILARDTFRVGDQIAVDDVAGTVTEISLTATRITSYDGRLVLVPNSVLHATTVTVQTGFDHVRSTVPLDVDGAADLDLAISLAEQTMVELPGVLRDPAPQALLREVGSATVRIDLRFWSGARQMDTRVAQHQVIRAVLAAYEEAGVKTGSEALMLDVVPDLRAALLERDS